MLRRLNRSLRSKIRSVISGESFPSIFSAEAPSPQAVVDLFKGDWAAGLPLPGVVSGERPDLFADPRIQWFLEHVGASIQGASVLELGPLEGAHSAMLEKAGAGSVTGIEANGRAFLKCLAVKELLALERCRFQYGDFVKYMAQTEDRYDLGVACGVFYHLRDPHLVLESLKRRVAGPVFLWTHHWEEGIARQYPRLHRNFSATRRVEFHGRTLELHRHEYGTHVFHKGFFGGNARYSEWLEKASLLSAIEACGWKVVATRDDSNPNGPAASYILEPAR